MSIMESIAVTLHYPSIHLFYKDIYDITWYGGLFILFGLMYLRYKKMISFITLKCLGLMTVIVTIIGADLYVGWGWIDLFFIFMVYISIEAFEGEMQKEEQNQQNNCQGLDGKHKKEKSKLSRTA